MRKRGFGKIEFDQFIRDVGLRKDIKDIYNDIKLPRRGTINSAGYDIYSPYDFILKCGEKIIVPTGIKVYMLNDEYFSILSRSSVGFKYNVRLCNQVGIIDADYYDNSSNEGHILLALQNEGDKEWVVKKGDKIVQGIFNKYLLIDDDISIIEKREGGIGSTNEKVKI